MLHFTREFSSSDGYKMQEIFDKIEKKRETFSAGTQERRNAGTQERRNAGTQERQLYLWRNL